MLPSAQKNKSPYILISNWKMYLTYKESCAWAAEQFENIGRMCQETNTSFVICPSYDALASIAPHAQRYGLLLGAQDCSAYKAGAYTSQVSASSLAQVGCDYCIIGHSETRQQYTLSSADITQKIKQLLDNNITPVVCIGETQQEYVQQETIDVLIQQLEPLVPALKESKKVAYIAYEPIWSIGTGNMPSSEHLKKVYDALAQFCKTAHIKPICFIYGGSIDETNVTRIINISHIQGILVGKASTDFQKIKTIVSLLKKDYSSLA